MAPRLLIFDDEQDVLLIDQLILEPEGYDVHLASSGFLQAMNLDHVLLDLIMRDDHVGKSGGNEPLWQQLKAFPLTSVPSLILWTADANALSEQEDALRETGVHVVLKPCASVRFFKSYSKRSRKPLLSKPRRQVGSPYMLNF
jgi:CheY-like chemotaxis protein